MDNFGLNEGPKSPLQAIKEAEDEVHDLNNEQNELRDSLDHVSLDNLPVENMELTFIPDFICHDFTNFQSKRLCTNDNFTQNVTQELKAESFIMDITTCDSIKRIKVGRPTKVSESKYFDLNVTQEQSNVIKLEDEMELTINTPMADNLFINDSIIPPNTETTLNLPSENVNVCKNLTNLHAEGAGNDIKVYDCTSQCALMKDTSSETSKIIAEKEDKANSDRLTVSEAKDTNETDNILLSIKPLFQKNSFDSAGNLLKVNENILFIRYLFQPSLGSITTNSRGKIIQDVPQSEIHEELFIDNLFKGNSTSINKTSPKQNEKNSNQNMQLLPYVNLDMKFNLNRILINLIPPMIFMSKIKWLHIINLPSISVNFNDIQSKDVSPFIMDKQQSINLYRNCKIIMRKKSLQCLTEDTVYKQIEDVCNKLDEAIGDAFSQNKEFSPFVTAFVEENEIPCLKVKNKKHCKDDNKFNKQGLFKGYFSKMGGGMVNKHDKGENKENREIVTAKIKKSQPVLKDINEFKLFSLLKKVREKERVKGEKKELPTPNPSRKKFWTLPANNKITRRNQHVTNKDDFQTKDGLIKRNWDFLRETFTKKT